MTRAERIERGARALVHYYETKEKTEQAVEKLKAWKLAECEDCGATLTEQQLNNHQWHCPECGYKIGD